MSQLEVDKIIPQSGTTLTIGDSGDTINFADGQNISIDTNTLYIDSTNNRVGIGTTTPQEKLDIETPTGSASETGLKIRNGTSATDAMAQIKLQGAYASTSNEATAIISGGRDGTGNASKITFSTGTTSQSERMRITSAGLVGIGTSNPTNPLMVQGSQGYASSASTLLTSTTKAAARIRGSNDASTSLWMGVETSNANPYLQVSNGTGTSSDPLLLQPFGGNVGIGTTSPAQALDIIDTTNYRQISISNSASTETKRVSYMAKHYDVSEEPVNLVGMFADSSTTVVSVGGGLGATGGFNSATQIQFHTATNNTTTGNSEAMRIDSTGSVLINTTSSSTTTSGVKLRGDIDAIAAVRDSNPSGYFRRLNSDGDIINLGRDTATNGRIGVKDTGLYIGDSDSAIYMDGADNAVLPFDCNTVSENDDFVSIGNSTYRFKDLYLSGGAYLGGTGTANKLDDYEEGTFTPTLDTGTATSAQGSYVKIGNLVNINVYIPTISDTSTASILRINNLPFLAKDSANSVDSTVGSVMLRYFNEDADTQNLVSYVTHSNNNLQFYEIRDNITYEQIDHADFSNVNIGLRASITYRTT